MKIKKGILSVNVSNLDSALRFYSKLLGFRVISKYGTEFGEVQGYGLTIGLRHSSKSQSAAPQEPSIVLEVEDIDSAVSELKSMGVVFLGNVIEEGRARVASFQDTDANLLHLSQTKKGIWS